MINFFPHVPNGLCERSPWLVWWLSSVRVTDTSFNANVCRSNRIISSLWHQGAHSHIYHSEERKKWMEYRLYIPLQLKSHRTECGYNVPWENITLFSSSVFHLNKTKERKLSKTARCLSTRLATLSLPSHTNLHVQVLYILWNYKIFYLQWKFILSYTTGH